MMSNRIQILIKKTQTLVLASAAILALGACSKSSTQSANGFYCSVNSVNLVGTNQLSMNISASGGNPNYTISSASVSGYTGYLASGSTTFASSQFMTLQFSGVTNSSLQGDMGTVTIYDSSNASSSCSFLVPGTGTNGVSCTMTPSTTAPGLNQAVSYSITGSGGTGSYTFSNFTPGTAGTITSNLSTISSTQATASASYSTAGTSYPSVYVTDSSGNSGSCSSTVTVQSTSNPGGTFGCTLAYSVSGGNVTLTATSSNGEPLRFASINAGSTDGYVSSFNNPSTVTYSASGQKTVTATAYSTTTNTYCNGGNSMTASFYVYGSTTSALACNVIISPGTIYRGSYASVYPQVTQSGAGNVTATSLTYNNQSGISGYWVNSTTAQLYFPYAGYWPVTLYIQDSAGSTGSCTGYATVQ